LCDTPAALRLTPALLAVRRTRCYVWCYHRCERLTVLCLQAGKPTGFPQFAQRASRLDETYTPPCRPPPPMEPRAYPPNATEGSLCVPSCPPGVGNTRPGFAATPHPSREPLRVLFCQGAARSAFSWGKRFFRTGGDAATASAPGSLWFGSFAPPSMLKPAVCVCRVARPVSRNRSVGFSPCPSPLGRLKTACIRAGAQCYSPECNPV